MRITLSSQLSSQYVQAEAGMFSLSTGAPRDSLLYVPSQAATRAPLPLALVFHGATHEPEAALALFRPFADALGLLILAPASYDKTWDLIRHRKAGQDIVVVEALLDYVHKHYTIDAARIAVAGFSDGASYALSMGLANGDIFTHILAFSPGSVGRHEAIGTPGIFVTHGTQDPVLNIDHCGRNVVRGLEKAGYQVHFKEFAGVHEVPATLARESLEFMFGLV